MKKALIVGLTPPLEGGSETHIKELEQRISNSWALTQKGSSCQKKIELFILSSKGFLKSISFFGSALAYSVGMLLSKKRFDIVHIHENFGYFLAPLLKIRYKVIITVHGITGFKFYENKILWFFFKNALKFADKIVSVSIGDKHELEKDGLKVEYVPNGVDLALMDEIKSVKEKKRIVFVGRIHEQKGLRYLLEAFNSLSKELKDYELHIIGKNEGEYYEYIKKEFPNTKVKFRGFITDRKKLFNEIKSAQILVFPSLWEALPWPALLEGMSSGKPVIASDLKGMRLVFKDGKNIVLTKPSNSKDIAQKLMYLVKNKTMAHKIGKEGEKLARKYSWDSTSEKIEKIYNKV